MEWAHRILLKFRFYRYLMDLTKVIILPGFKPLPLYTVATFFFAEMKRDSLANRASSLAYSFMLSIFPGIIFLFTLLPYITINHFQDTFLKLLSDILPTSVFMVFQTTIVDIVKTQNLSLLSFGFLSAMVFATNGVDKLMQAFNKSSLIVEDRSWLQRRWVALVLTILIFLSLFGAIIIMIISQTFIGLIQSQFYSKGHFWIYPIMLLRWIIVTLLYFVTVSLLYRYGPAHKRRWRFLSPGSILATSLAVIISFVFTIYINHFPYNKVYGSIGTLIVAMLWLNLNSMILIIGFELNASIDLSKRTIKIVKPRYNTLKLQKQTEAKQNLPDSGNRFR